MVGGVWVSAQGDALANALLALQSSNPVADARVQEANAAALLANASNNRLAAVSADNILKAFEKAEVLGIHAGLQEDRTNLLALGASLGLTAESVALQAAFDELDDYLATLMSPVAWNDTQGDTNMTTI